MNKPKAPRIERKAEKKKSGLPSRDELLAFVASNPGAASKRDLARHFGIKGNDKIELKRMLTAHPGVFIATPEYSASVPPLLTAWSTGAPGTTRRWLR